MRSSGSASSAAAAAALLPCGHRADDLREQCQLCAQHYHAMESMDVEGAQLVLEVVSLAGGVMCRLRCSPRAQVSAVRRRIARLSGIPADHQLVHAGAVLRDADTMERCIAPAGGGDGGAGAAVVLQCVRSRRLSLLRGLEALGRSPDPEVAAEGSLSSVLEEVMQAEHRLSEQCRPRNAASLARAIELGHRAELINWMVQAFDVLQFDDGMLHSVVLTLDRYYSTRTEPIEVSQIQRVLLAAVCTEMKLAGADEFPPGHWQRVLVHLCRGAIAIPTILRTEYELLSGLGFQAWAPSPVAFLRELSMHMELPMGGGKMVTEAALFLLDLAMFEPELQYRRPHAMLAAGALSGGLRVVEASEALRADCARARDVLFEDMISYDPDQFCGARREALACEEELLQLWLARAANYRPCHWAHLYRHVEAKALRRSLEAANRLGGAVGGGPFRLSADVAAGALRRAQEAQARGD